MTIKGVWGFNGTERPGAVYLAAVLAGHAQKGLPAFGIYGHDVQDADATDIPEDVVEKTVHWYLMMADSYYSKPQREEYFVDSGYYKYHEAYHLLKFPNEKQMLERAYEEYQELKKNNLWGSHRYE